MKIVILRLLAIVTFSSISVLAQAQSISVVVPLTPAGEFTIKSDKIIGKLKKKGTKFTAAILKTPISSLKTGIKLRDKHTHERFGAPAEKFITVKDVKISDGKGTANMTVNKVTKPIKFEATEDGSSVVVKFTVNPSDFKLKNLSYMNVGADGEVEAEISVPYE